MQRRTLAVLIPVALAAGLATASAQTTVVIQPAAAPPGPAMAVAPPEMIAPAAPPSMQVETIPPAPSATVSWQPGHWRWAGTSWAWAPGQYVARPQQTAVWEPGRWEPQPGGTYGWIDGHWHN